MVATEVLKVRVPPETKQIVRSLAQQQQLTESALLMRLVETLLQTSGAIRATTFDPTGRVNGPTGQDLRALLRACEALRDHVKGLIQANGASWESGYAQTCR